MMNLPTIEENEIEICIPAKSSGGDVLDVTFVVGQSAKPIRHDVTVGTILSVELPQLSTKSSCRRLQSRGSTLATTSINPTKSN